MLQQIKMKKYFDNNDFKSANEKTFIILNDDVFTKNFFGNFTENELLEKFFDGEHAIDAQGCIYQFLTKKSMNLIDFLEEEHAAPLLIYTSKFFVCNHAEDGEIF